MSKRRVVIFGDPVLRKKARRIEKVNDPVRALAADMVETLRSKNGVGLAAQQVGETIAICVIHIPAGVGEAGGNRESWAAAVAAPLVLVNPEIVESDGVECAEEGCLSFPDIFAQIKRAREVAVAFQGLDGAKRVLRGDGLFARAVQHELDHLNGILIVDRMSAIRKVALSGKLKKLRQKSKESPPETRD